jgi:signal transduction histidine kinase/FixJ family two-component response regulator/HPt (histidine-containing phosphotransfer) domain-containing protein
MSKIKLHWVSAVNKAMLITLASMILIFALMTGLAVNSVYRSNLNILQNQDELHAKHTALLVQDSFKYITGMLTLVQESLEPMNLSVEQERQTADGLLTAMMELNPNVMDAWFAFKRDVYEPGLYYVREFIRRNGVIENVPRDWDDGTLEDTGKNPWIAEPLATGEVYFDGVGSYDYGSGIGEVYTATLALPILGTDRESGGETVVGVCGIDIQYRDMFLPIDSPETVQTHTTVLLSDDMRILHAHDPALVGSYLTEYIDVESLNGSETIDSPFTGERSLVSLHPILVEAANWSLPLFAYMEMPVERMDSSAGHVAALMIIAGVFSLSVLLGITYITIYNFVKPLKKLTSDAQQIARGNLNISFHAVKEKELSNPKNEVAMLQRSLMTMVETLKNHLNVVEQRVDERTYELKLMSKEAEEAKDRAEESDVIKTQFLANMSHEIRTPMNAIIGMSDLMLSEELSQHQRRYAEDIKISATSLLGIINDILDISKIQSRKLNLIPTHYDFWALLDNINSIVGFLVSEQSVTFTMSMPDNLPRCLYGDDVRLRQILLNVLSNAAKFTEKGFVRMEIQYNGADMEFVISDSGVGIREEAIPYLFDTFTQADPQKNRKRTGTGLGLSITKSLVQMMGGKISVKSVYGEGSVFSITLPVVLGDEAKLEPDEKSSDAVYAPNASVLVVDDNAINLNVACGLLRLCGITADTAMSGAQAIEMVLRNAYDLVFMDHMMPEMDGNQVTVNLREKGVTIPIVALTANAVAGSKDLFLSAGMNDLLVKPIEKPLLYRILEKWLPPEKLQTPPEPELSDADMHDALFRKLEGIKTLSVELGLARVSGQRDVYESSLKHMIRQIAKDSVSLPAFLEAVDMRSFTITAHSLKGSLANIGAMQLSDYAQELEEAGARDDAVYCALNISDFIRALDELHTDLTNAFAVLKSKKPADIPPELPLIFARLERALDTMNFAEIDDAVETLKAMRLGGALADAVQDIKDAVLIMEYEEVKNIMRKVLET